MSAGKWQALVLAAGRGPADPMAMVHGVANKCAIPVAGIPMLRRVHDALTASGLFNHIAVSIDDRALAESLLGSGAHLLASSSSAPASVLAALASGALRYPVLITTGDHALLTPPMIAHFCAVSENSGADFTAGLARAETILAAYPQTLRTFFRFGGDRVSGCNLFALMNASGLPLIERWQYLEGVRKRPWRLAAAFGPIALLRFALGALSLDAAFATVSTRLRLIARPVILPFPEAAIDIDKPADQALAEKILATRQ